MVHVRSISSAEDTRIVSSGNKARRRNRFNLS